MSRIGKSPITIPAGVEVTLGEGVITVKGKLGQLTQEFSDVTVKVEGDQITVERSSDYKDQRAKHGLYRSLINNMITGVSTGFTNELELVGVGYRASNAGQKLDLALGYSHNIVLEIAPEVTVETISEKGKKITINLSVLSISETIVGDIQEHSDTKFVYSYTESGGTDKIVETLSRK